MLCFVIYLCYNARNWSKGNRYISSMTNKYESYGLSQLYNKAFIHKEDTLFGLFGIGIPLTNLQQSADCLRFIGGLLYSTDRVCVVNWGLRMYMGACIVSFSVVSTVVACALVCTTMYFIWIRLMVTTCRVMDQFEPDIYTWHTKDLNTQWNMISQLVFLL